MGKSFIIIFLFFPPSNSDLLSLLDKTLFCKFNGAFYEEILHFFSSYFDLLSCCTKISFQKASPFKPEGYQYRTGQVVGHPVVTKHVVRQACNHTDLTSSVTQITPTVTQVLCHRKSRLQTHRSHVIHNTDQTHGHTDLTSSVVKGAITQISLHQ